MHYSVKIKKTAQSNIFFKELTVYGLYILETMTYIKQRSNPFMNETIIAIKLDETDG